MRKVPLCILAFCTLSRMVLLPTLAEGFEADVASRATDPAQREIRLTNRSPDALGPGRLTLYAEDADGQREPVSVLQVTEPVQPDVPLPVLSFTPPAGATGYVAVFEGQLGQEAAAVVGLAMGRGVSKPK